MSETSFASPLLDHSSLTVSSMATLAYTPVGQIPAIVKAARSTYDSGKSRPIEWRIQQLKQIRKMVEDNTDEIVKALRADLRRPEFEGQIAEAMTVIAEVQHALSHIHTWAKPETVETPAAMLPGTSYVVKEPLGVVLIIAPWNFPIQLILNPLVAAICAGNVCVLKPSEVAPASAELVGRLIPAYLDTDAVKIVQGAVGETEALLAERWDHIFYTGNSAVGKLIMAAAAKNLTPVTLELGGKSPAIVDKTANLDIAAKRIMASKCMNAGQVCIAPDYVLVDREVQGPLISKMKDVLKGCYGADPQRSPDLGRIVNKRHFERVRKLLTTTSGEVVEGGGVVDEKDLYIAPTIIREPKPSDPVMQEEIFGPLLPVIAVDGLDDAIKRVNAGEKPLALYIYSSSSRNQKKILSSTSSGGVTINDCVMHIANPDLPFGGVGNSGLGAYHGKVGFDALSHRRAVFHQTTMVDTASLRFPPFSAGKLRLVRTLLTHAPGLPNVGFKDLLILGLSAAVVALSTKLSGKW